MMLVGWTKVSIYMYVSVAYNWDSNHIMVMLKATQYVHTHNDGQCDGQTLQILYLYKRPWTMVRGKQQRGVWLLNKQYHCISLYAYISSFVERNEFILFVFLCVHVCTLLSFTIPLVEILVAPMSMVAVLDSTVTFCCDAIADISKLYKWTEVLVSLQLHTHNITEGAFNTLLS